MSRNIYRDKEIDRLNRRQRIKDIALCTAIILAVLAACILLPHYFKPQY